MVYPSKVREELLDEDHLQTIVDEARDIVATRWPAADTDLPGVIDQSDEMGGR